jgi:hypothetical protein
VNVAVPLAGMDLSGGHGADQDSMIKPTPFCPSFDPCAKLTPVQVTISSPRIHQGGGWLSTGALERLGIGRTALASSNSSPHRIKPAHRENNSERPTPIAWLQSTPLVRAAVVAINWFITPTPMIEPISACELELGMPKYQVPTFQMIAAISSATP